MSPPLTGPRPGRAQDPRVGGPTSSRGAGPTKARTVLHSTLWIPPPSATAQESTAPRKPGSQTGTTDACQPPQPPSAGSCHFHWGGPRRCTAGSPARTMKSKGRGQVPPRPPTTPTAAPRDLDLSPNCLAAAKTRPKGVLAAPRHLPATGTCPRDARCGLPLRVRVRVGVGSGPLHPRESRPSGIAASRGPPVQMGKLRLGGASTGALRRSSGEALEGGAPAPGRGQVDP